MKFLFFLFHSFFFKPRLDKLATGETILWYGKKSRKFIILF